MTATLCNTSLHLVPSLWYLSNISLRGVSEGGRVKRVREGRRDGGRERGREGGRKEGSEKGREGTREGVR